MEDENKIDDFLNQQPAAKDDQQQPTTQETDEDLIEKHARSSGKPTARTVLQKKTQLSEDKLESRIDQILVKHAGKINEQELRAKIATHLEKHDTITEADLSVITDNLLAEYDSKQTEQTKNGLSIAVPPVLASAGQVAGQRVSNLADRFSALKTPGGIGLLVGVLLLMIWIMIPVNNGQTRLQLLFGILTGQVTFTDNIEAAEREVAGLPGVAGSAGTSGGGGSQADSYIINNGYTVKGIEDYY